MEGQKTHTEARHILGTLKKTAVTAERGRGTGRGASPARFAPSSLLCRAAPPRPRRRRRAARGPSEPSAARSRERERERASSQPPAGSGGEWRCFPTAQLEFKETDASRGVGPLAQRGARRTTRSRSELNGTSMPCEKSFLPAGRPQPGLRNAEHKLQGERKRDPPPPSLGDYGGGGSDLYAQQVIPLFSVALVSVLVHRLSSMKAHRQMGITVSRDAGV